eukprot:COSAG01_NODE_2253_length_8073_cov_14.930524_5_plen_188_part_00
MCTHHCARAAATARAPCADAAAEPSTPWLSTTSRPPRRRRPGLCRPPASANAWMRWCPDAGSAADQVQRATLPGAPAWPDASTAWYAASAVLAPSPSSSSPAAHHLAVLRFTPRVPALWSRCSLSSKRSKESQPPGTVAVGPSTRVRCVSIFLDGNRRYIGKSQTKRPPKRTRRTPHRPTPPRGAAA